MSEKPRKRLVSKREYIKILRADISIFTSHLSIIVMLLGAGVFFLWMAWGMVSSFLVLQSPWYAYLLPILCVGLSLLPLYIGLILMLLVDTPNVKTVTFIASKTAPPISPEESLLRASDLPPSHQQAELLRAAGQGAETPPEELLRAVQGNKVSWPWLLLLLATGALLMLCACGTNQPSPSEPASSSHAVLPTEITRAAVIDVREVRRALTSAEAANYLGDKVCGACHARVAATHAHSAHAQTLRAVTVEQDGPIFRHANAVKDPRNHFTYGTVVQQNICQMLVFNKSVEAALPADFAVGSGKHARSYLNRDDLNGWVSLRLSYYLAAGKWDFSAGQPPERTLSSSMGTELKGPQVTACLLCHTTVVRSQAGLDLAGETVRADAYPDLAASSFGVGCERCHGPGRAHVDAVSHAKEPLLRVEATAKAVHETFGMEDLSRATPARITTLCGYCHRTLQNSDMRDPHNEADVPRFQGVALERSLCYQKSGSLSCLSCHDPHADADADRSHNDAVCLNCHSSTTARPPGERPSLSAGPVHDPQGVPCPVNPRKDCTGCHMPQQMVALGPGVQYTNHWIKVWPGTAGRSRPPGARGLRRTPAMPP